MVDEYRARNQNNRVIRRNRIRRHRRQRGRNLPRYQFPVRENVGRQGGNRHAVVVAEEPQPPQRNVLDMIFEIMNARPQENVRADGERVENAPPPFLLGAMNPDPFYQPNVLQNALVPGNVLNNDNFPFVEGAAIQRIRQERVFEEFLLRPPIPPPVPAPILQMHPILQHLPYDFDLDRLFNPPAPPPRPVVVDPVVQLDEIVMDNLRSLSALVMRGDRINDEDAFKIADEHFEALESIQSNSGRIGPLFPLEVKSNLFGEVVVGEPFFEKMNEFKTARWRVTTARFSLQQIVLGTLVCDKSDQAIRYGLAWEREKGYFVLHSIDRIDFPYADIKIPLDRLSPFSELGELRRQMRRHSRRIEMRNSI